MNGTFIKSLFIFAVIVTKCSELNSVSLRSTDLKGFAKDCLDAHNAKRALHGIQPLSLSNEINSFAQQWSNNIAKNSVMKHRSPNKFGENIYYAQSSDPNFKVPCKKVVDKWYSEISMYTFGSEPASKGTGHFTQVVWKSSKKLGCGMAKNSNNQIFIVCNYDPPGNYVGQHAANVAKSKRG